MLSFPPKLAVCSPSAATSSQDTVIIPLESACSLHCSSVLGLPYRILIIYLVKPKKGTTMETIGGSYANEPTTKLGAGSCPGPRQAASLSVSAGPSGSTGPGSGKQMSEDGGGVQTPCRAGKEERERQETAGQDAAREGSPLKRKG